MGGLTGSLGPRNVIILVTLIMSVCLTIMFVTPNLVVFIAAAIGNSVFFLASPMYYQLAGASTEGEESNTMFSAIASTRAISQLMGKVLGGYVLAAFPSPDATFYSPGFFYVISAALCV